MKKFSYQEFEQYNPVCITVKGTLLMQKVEKITNEEGNEETIINRIYITRHTFNAICECMNNPKNTKYVNCDAELPMFLEDRKGNSFVCIPKFA